MFRKWEGVLASHNADNWKPFQSQQFKKFSRENKESYASAKNQPTAGPMFAPVVALLWFHPSIDVGIAFLICHSNIAKMYPTSGCHKEAEKVGCLGYAAMYRCSPTQLFGNSLSCGTYGTFAT